MDNAALCPMISRIPEMINHTPIPIRIIAPAHVKAAELMRLIIKSPKNMDIKVPKVDIRLMTNAAGKLILTFFMPKETKTVNVSRLEEMAQRADNIKSIISPMI